MNEEEPLPLVRDGMASVTKLCCYSGYLDSRVSVPGGSRGKKGGTAEMLRPLARCLQLVRERGFFMFALFPQVLEFEKEKGMVKTMKDALERIRQTAADELAKCADGKELESLRVKFLGKKGELTAILKQMGGLSADERPKMGQLANEVRSAIESALLEKQAALKNVMLEHQLRSERIDVTMPGTQLRLGKPHPLTLVMDEIKEIFLGMGFDVVSGPEIEYDKYNFEMLNMPKDHPSRDTQDTFYIDENIVLRTQTSPVQARVMEKTQPPIRIISPGRVYRSDAVDATHSPLFHQIEGLVVDKDITMADLKGTLEAFVKRLYGDDAVVRFRPHHFAFTEPSAELDTMCFHCHGEGCRLCKGEGWIELLGCGMVNPKVLKNCGIDPELYSGFAFGMGLERVVMRRFNIGDMRLFFENDLRFLDQF